MISRAWAKKLITYYISSFDVAGGLGLRKHMEWSTVLMFAKFILDEQLTITELRAKLAILRENTDQAFITANTEEVMEDYANGQQDAIAFLESLINDLEPRTTDLMLWAQNGNITKPGAYGKLNATIETEGGIVEAGAKCRVMHVLDNGILVVQLVEAPGGIIFIPYQAFGKID